MWQETKRGLYKQFNFENFKQAWKFLNKVAEASLSIEHYPRIENEWSVVQIWLITHESSNNISEKDRFLAKTIDDIFSNNHPDHELKSNFNHLTEVKVFADGGSRGNPGPSASGFVILDMNDQILVDRGVYIGITTNNQAEYMALKLALEECRKMNFKKIKVFMDSMLVVNQMKGIFKVKNRDLWPVHDAIKQLLPSFESVHFQQVPREFNKLADAAVNRALNEQHHQDLNSK